MTTNEFMTPENVCVRVISLPHDGQRLSRFCRGLESTDLADARDFRVQPAVDGKRMSDDELRRVTTEQGYRDIIETERTGRRNYHYQLSRGAIGCYLSHLNILRSLAVMLEAQEDDERRQRQGGKEKDDKEKDDADVPVPEYVAVFEDDARFPEYTEGCSADVLKRANEIVSRSDQHRRWDILMLGCLPVKYDLVYFDNSNSNGVMHLKRFFGTHAMIVPVRSTARLARLLGDGVAIAQQIDSALSDLAERDEIRVLAPARSVLVQEHFDLVNPEQSNIQLPLIPEDGGRDPADPMPSPYTDVM